MKRPFNTLKPDLWGRYIEDELMIWSHSLGEFDTFLEDLNKMRERIRFHPFPIPKPAAALKPLPQRPT